MKALSLGLVRGFIDQVDEKVYMTWVQPRVLDLAQVRRSPNCSVLQQESAVNRIGNKEK